MIWEHDPRYLRASYPDHENRRGTGHGPARSREIHRPPPLGLCAGMRLRGLSGCRRAPWLSRVFLGATTAMARLWDRRGSTAVGVVAWIRSRMPRLTGAGDA